MNPIDNLRECVKVYIVLEYRTNYNEHSHVLLVTLDKNLAIKEAKINAAYYYDGKTSVDTWCNNKHISQIYFYNNEKTDEYGCQIYNEHNQCVVEVVQSVEEVYE